MSLYNFLMSENPDYAVLLGALGLDKNSFGRYRDIHLNADGSVIIVYTRLGGQNRKDYKQFITNLRRHPNYLKDYDDDYDDTYAYFEFSVPEKYKGMCKSMSTGKDPETVSEKFKEQIKMMEVPGSVENEKAKEIAKMLEEAMNDDSNGGIHIIGI